SVSQNPSLGARAASLTIGDQTFTISQIGADCAYTLSPAALNFNYGPTNGILNVTTSSNGCGWTVVNTNPWINVLAGSYGTGNGTVLFALAANPLGAVRIGSLNIGGQSATISQAASPCVFSLGAASFSCNYLQTNGQVGVTVFSSCGWAVNNSNNWINVTSSTTNNSGNGTVRFTVLDNPTGLPRTGLFTIADQLFTVTQAAAPCTYN